MVVLFPKNEMCLRGGALNEEMLVSKKHVLF